MSNVDVVTELHYDGTWNDESENNRQTTAITRGRGTHGTDVDAGVMDLQLNNRDGRFSPRNPVSPLATKIGRNSPVRVRVPSTETGVTLWNAQNEDPLDVDGWLITQSVAVTGDIDIRVDLNPYPTWTPNFAMVLGAKWRQTGDNRSWSLSLQRFTGGTWFLTFRWYTDGTAATVQTRSSVVQPSLIGRQTVRVTLDVDNGAAQNVATFYTGTGGVDGSFTQIHQSTAAGTTSIFAGTAGVTLGAVDSGLVGFAGFNGTNGFRGVIHGFQLRDGINGTVVVQPVFDAVEPDASPFSFAPDLHTTGWLAFTSAFAEPNMARFAPDAYRPDIRMAAEVQEWPPEWDTSGSDVWTPITARGVINRMGSPGRPTYDAVHRMIRERRTAGLYDLRGYWALADPAGSRRASVTEGEFAAPLEYPIRLSAPQFGDGQLGFWLPPGMLSGEGTGNLRGAVSGPPGGWAIDVMFRAPDPGSWGDEQPQRVAVTMEDSGAIRWSAIINTVSGNLDLRITNLETGSTISLTSVPLADYDLLDGNPHYIRLTTFEAASTNTSVFVDVDGVTAIGVSVNIGVSVTPPPMLVGLVWTRVDDTFSIPVTFGQLIVWGNAGSGSASIPLNLATEVYFGWRGENAATRIARLLREEEIPFTVYCSQSEAVQTQQLGSQEMVTTLQLLRNAADVDGGILIELRDQLGIGYWPLFALYDQVPTLTQDYGGASGGQVNAPFQPSENTRRTVNSATFQQAGTQEAGSVQLSSGPLSVQDPPNGVGVYPVNRDINTFQPFQLHLRAGWEVHIGTWDEAEYPMFTIDLRGAAELLKLPEMREAALALDSGQRVDVVNLPAWMPPEDVQMMVQGSMELVDSQTHVVTFNCSPYGPFEIGQFDDIGSGVTRGSRHGPRLDQASLLTPVDEDDTSLSIGSLARWINTADHASQFPFDIKTFPPPGQYRPAGEVMTVTAITPGMVDTFSRTEANGWGTADSGQLWVVVDTPASDYSVSSGRGRILSTTDLYRRIVLDNLVVSNGEVLTSLALSSTSGVVLSGIVARMSDVDNQYEFLLDNDGDLSIAKVVGGVGSQIAPFTPLPGWAATSLVWMRVQLDGPILRMKAWLDGSIEPGNWTFEVEDHDHSSGALGAIHVRSSGTTVETSWDSFEIVNSQVFTVTRSVNRVEMPHPSDTAIMVVDSLRYAL